MHLFCFFPDSIKNIGVIEKVIIKLGVASVLCDIYPLHNFVITLTWSVSCAMSLKL